MGIQIGSQIISNIFTQTYSEGVQPPSSGSVIGLQSGSYDNGSTWTSTTGSAGVVINSPLASGSNGRWQFNGTDEYILISSSQLSGFNQAENANQEFTFLFYGTIGSVSTRRALFGCADGGYNPGGDAIFRTDSSPGAGKIHLDLRGPTGNTNRFTITGDSGSLLNLAITQNTAGTASVYQNGTFLASSGTLALGYAPFKTGSNQVGAFIGYNGDVDADNYNGQLGASYLYNRVLSTTEISQSALSFSSGSPAGMVISPITSVFLGTSKVFPAISPIVSMSVQTLVVAGGGSGGTGTGGGGGAGGVVYSGSLTLNSGVYAVNVGSGGRATGSNNDKSPSGNRGADSSFVSGTIIVSASGGGGGIGYDQTLLDARNSGGSGGGTSAQRNTPGSGISGQGFAGGNWNGADNGCGSGGGGASQTGRQPTGAYPNGSGGNGASGSAYTIRSGTSVFYGGGGGGGNYVTSVNPGTGGPGGGTAGSKTATNPTSASANTGGGGGGSFRSAVGDNNGISGNGGSGIVVIAYLTSSAVGLSVSGGIEQTFDSGSLTYKSHTFLSSSNFVIS